MNPDQTQKARARFVRAVLEWHEASPSDLAELLGVTVDTAYKKLDGRRNFTSADLTRIAERYKPDPGLLLQPAGASRFLGDPPSGGSSSVWTYESAGQHHNLFALAA